MAYEGQERVSKTDIFNVQIGCIMDLLITGIVAGVIGTLIMDLLNNLVARTGVFFKIDVVMIGRMAAGWTRGRFRYEHPDEMEHVSNEMIYGYLMHFGIGVGLAVPFILSWGIWAGNPVPPICAFLYGVSTTAASFFFVYPSMGLGVCGMKSQEKIKAFISPLANHLFYGIGLALGVAII